jgi:hypothetical protein
VAPTFLLKQEVAQLISAANDQLYMNIIGVQHYSQYAVVRIA